MQKKNILIILTLIFSAISINSIAQNKQEAVADSNITYLKNIETLSDLLDKFKGKIIYIDVMASWCKGCIMQLPAANELDNYFKENNIVKVFITMDTDKSLKILKKNGVNGYFLPFSEAGEAFKKEFNDIYFLDKKSKDKVYVLPTYMIVDKDGNFVIRNAERPDNPDKLKAQLIKYF